MRKYWHVINIGLQNTLVYRFNFFCRSVFGLIPLMATIFLWRAIYESREGSEEVAGYTLASMISYYLVVTVVDMLSAVNEDDWQIAADIKDGNINTCLTKPMDYLTYRLCLFGAGRLIYTLVALAPVGLFIAWQSDHFIWPKDGVAFGCFLVSVGLTALLQFFISFTMAMLAFWVLEVSTFIFIAFAFEYIAGGHMFPLDILPPVVQKILSFTPFPYQMFFPVSIYVGRTSGPDMWTGLAIQAGWVAVFYLVARLVWRQGLKKYSAVGG